jgi:RNA polymerase sigma-70 factor (ECF subfamily)
MADDGVDIVLDEALVAAAVGGDDLALSRLLELLGPRVRDRLQIARRWQAVLDADDVMQTSYLEAFLRIGTLRTATVAGLSAWLARIAENNLRDAIRELERIKRPDPRRRIGEGPAGASRTALLETLGHTSHTASRDAREREATELLLAALTRLPDSYRQVVEAYDLQDRDVEEVAAALGRSKGAVYMLRARAHDRLRELLSPALHPGTSS